MVRKICLSKGTKVVFTDSDESPRGFHYEIESINIMECDKDCNIPHESCCWEEPHISVVQKSYKSIPLRLLYGVVNERGVINKIPDPTSIIIDESME